MLSETNVSRAEAVWQKTRQQFLPSGVPYAHDTSQDIIVPTWWVMAAGIADEGDSVYRDICYAKIQQRYQIVPYIELMASHIFVIYQEAVAADTSAPTPNPATFATAPYATGPNSIAMVATTGSDAIGPVQYYFDETSGNPGGSGSGWQISPSYTDTGLSAGTQYTYTVQMRDSVPNTGTASSPANATTDPPPGRVFSDNFESSTDWTNNWSAYGAWNRVTARKYDGSYSAEIDGDVTDSALVSVSIDVSGKSSATITFQWFIEQGLDTGEYLAFDTNVGAGWVQQANRQGNVDTENVWAGGEIVDVDVSGTSSMQIRFRGKMNKSNEDAYVDVVEVTAE